MRNTALSNITQSLALIAYIALIVFSPSIHFINYIEFHDAQRVIQLLLLTLVLVDAIFLGINKSRKISFNQYIKFGFLLLLGLASLSALQSIEPRQAVIEISISAALCYLALFTARLYLQHSERLIKMFIYALWTSILLYMISFYTGYVSAILAEKQLVWPAPFYGFSNIRLFQQYQLWAIGLICLPLLTFNLKKSFRIWFCILLSLWWVLLFYAASRGVMLGWLAAIILTAIVFKNLAWPFIRIQLLNAFFGLCAYQVLFKIMPNWLISATSSNTTNAIITHSIFRDTISDRTDLWKVALVMIYNFPTLGIGPMHFYFYNPFGTHPHNSILRLAAEYGLPATLIILTITGYSLYCWMKKFSIVQLKTAPVIDRHLSITLFFTITASATYSFVEGVELMPISQVLMFTVIGLMIGQYIKKSQPTNNQKSIVRPIFAAIVLFLMVLSTLPEMVRGLTSNNRVLQPNERAFSLAPDTINPRIWMQQRRVEKSESEPTLP